MLLLMVPASLMVPSASFDGTCFFWWYLCFFDGTWWFFLMVPDGLLFYCCLLSHCDSDRQGCISTRRILRGKASTFSPLPSVIPFLLLSSMASSLLLELCSYYLLTMALSPLLWDFALLFSCSDFVRLCLTGLTLSDFLLDFVWPCWALSDFVGLC